MVLLEVCVVATVILCFYEIGTFTLVIINLFYMGFCSNVRMFRCRLISVITDFYVDYDGRQFYYM